VSLVSVYPAKCHLFRSCLPLNPKRARFRPQTSLPTAVQYPSLPDRGCNLCTNHKPQVTTCQSRPPARRCKQTTNIPSRRYTVPTCANTCHLHLPLVASTLCCNLQWSHMRQCRMTRHTAPRPTHKTARKTRRPRLQQGPSPSGWLRRPRRLRLIRRLGRVRVAIHSAERAAGPFTPPSPCRHVALALPPGKGASVGEGVGSGFRWMIVGACCSVLCAVCCVLCALCSVLWGTRH
jgi:hypothetical protein